MQPSLSVLIADDTPTVREALKTVLELQGDIRVIGEADNGLMAVQLASQLGPDVVLMDLNMPVMDGYEAARQMRRIGLPCAIVALSVEDDAASRAKAEMAGIVALAPKGGSVRGLGALIHHASGRG